MIAAWGTLACVFLVVTVSSLSAARLPISDLEDRSPREPPGKERDGGGEGRRIVAICHLSEAALMAFFDLK